MDNTDTWTIQTYGQYRHMDNTDTIYNTDTRTIHNNNNVYLKSNIQTSSIDCTYKPI